MTPKEIHILSKIYRWLVQDLIEVFISFVFYGIFVLLFLVTTIIFIRQKNSRASRMARWAIFGTNAISFIFATLNIASQIFWFTIDLRAFFLDFIDLPLHKALDLTSQREDKAFMMANWVAYLNQIHTDAIIVWRACVLFPRQRWLMVAPIILLITLIVTSIVFFAFDYGTSALAVAIQNSDTDILEHWIIARYALSIGTNVAATILITYKFWTHRKRIKLIQKQSRMLNALFLMVESGVLYALLQIIFVVMSFGPTNDKLAVDLTFQVFNSVYFAILPMYPTIVIALVYLQRSMVDTYTLDCASSITEPCTSHVVPLKQGTCGPQLLTGDGIYTAHGVEEDGKGHLQKI